MGLSEVSGVTEEIVVRAYVDLDVEVTATIDATGVSIAIINGEEQPDSDDPEPGATASTYEGRVTLQVSHAVARKWAIALVRRIDKHLEEQERAAAETAGEQDANLHE